MCRVWWTCCSWTAPYLFRTAKAWRDCDCTRDLFFPNIWSNNTFDMGFSFCLTTWSHTPLASRRFFFARWSAFWTLAVWIFKCHRDNCGHKLSDRLTVFLDRAEWRLWRNALCSFTVSVPRVESHAARESTIWMLPKAYADHVMMRMTWSTLVRPKLLLCLWRSGIHDSTTDRLTMQGEYDWPSWQQCHRFCILFREHHDTTKFWSRRIILDLQSARMVDSSQSQQILKKRLAFLFSRGLFWSYRDAPVFLSVLSKVCWVEAWKNPVGDESEQSA